MAEQTKTDGKKVETVAKTEYEKVLAELDELKGKLPKEPTEQELAFQQKEQELFDKSVQLELKENGLDQFASIIKVENEDDLKTTIDQLKQITNQIKIDSGYVPNDHAKDDDYSNFAKDNDTVGMIGTKLSKLFK